MKLKDPSKARHAMRQFKRARLKGKRRENNALEDNVAIITRASLKEFGLLANQLKKYCPTCSDSPVVQSDHYVLQTVDGVQRKSRSGFGPYRGLNVPSSGFVAAYAMLSSELCNSG